MDRELQARRDWTRQAARIVARAAERVGHDADCEDVSALMTDAEAIAVQAFLHEAGAAGARPELRLRVEG